MFTHPSPVTYFYKMKFLIISTVHIEPTSSAAGARLLQLVKVFLEHGYEITYATTAGPSENAFDLRTLGIKTEFIKVNDPSFDAFAKTLNPSTVLFDRFMAEEQFGWRIDEHCPEALKLLDTEDLHCLRSARGEALKERRDFKEIDLISDIAKREIAAIYRCDLTLMISQVEIAMLIRFFKLPEALLIYIPFLLEEFNTNYKSFADREGFISIGNFLHPPNWDAVRVLKEQIWPLIRKQLPEAQLNIYGAYPSEKVRQLHNSKDGFIIKGRAEDAIDVLSSAKVLLAPLRFGAGLKGKFIDAMQSGTPSVTTSVGAEGMQGGWSWPGAIEDDFKIFAKASISFYKKEEKWSQAQQQGATLLKANFNKADFEGDLINRINALRAGLQVHRTHNFTGLMLQHHAMRSTKFMSKWIEEKNR